MSSLTHLGGAGDSLKTNTLHPPMLFLNLTFFTLNAADGVLLRIKSYRYNILDFWFKKQTIL